MVVSPSAPVIFSFHFLKPGRLPSPLGRAVHPAGPPPCDFGMEPVAQAFLRQGPAWPEFGPLTSTHITHAATAQNVLGWISQVVALLGLGFEKDEKSAVKLDEFPMKWEHRAVKGLPQPIWR